MHSGSFGGRFAVRRSHAHRSQLARYRLTPEHCRSPLFPAITLAIANVIRRGTLLSQIHRHDITTARMGALDKERSSSPAFGTIIFIGHFSFFSDFTRKKSGKEVGYCFMAFLN